MNSPLEKNLKTAIDTLRNGGMVSVFDDTSRTACGYFLLPALAATEEKVNFIIQEGRGILLCPIQEEHAQELGLSSPGDLSKTSFPLTIGVEARSGISTGISTADRTQSILALCSWEQKSKTIIAPGHIFPMIGKKGGLLVKSGIAEAALDLLRISTQKEIAVISHILNTSGDFLNENEVIAISKKNQIPFIKISEIIQHRLRREPLITKIAKTRLPTQDYGTFSAHCYISNHDKAEHLVLTKNIEGTPDEPILVRVHSERKLGDLFLKTTENSRQKLGSALSAIHKEGKGALVYIRKQKTNILSSQIENICEDSSSKKQHETEKASELRELGIGAQMLLDLDIKNLRLLTTTPKPFIDLSVFNLQINEHVLLQ